ncbi:Tyrosine recombinase XerC [subsurface metagenome]
MGTTELRLENLLKQLPSADREKAEEFFEDRELVLTSKVSYLDTLVPFYRHVKKSLAEATKGDVQGWIKSERKRQTARGKIGISPTTLQIHKVHLKTFYRWLNGGKEAPECVEWIKGTRRKRDLPAEEILNQEEIRRIIEACDNPRDKAMVAVLYESAARIGEFLSLKIRNVDFDKYGGIILLPKNQEGLKTGSRRIRLIDTAPYLQGWINAHPKKNDPDAPLWLGNRGTALKITQTQALIKKYTAKAGVKKRVHPHLFRHSRLTALAKMPYINEMDLRIIAGWTRDSAMPAVYLHLGGRDVDRKLLQHRGLLEEEEKLEAEEKPLEPLKCPRCETINPADAKFCYKCSMALTLKAVVELEEKRERADDLMNRLFEDPEVRDLLKRKIEKM